MSKAALQHAPQKSAPQHAPSFTPVRSGLLQRKCACGGTPGPDGECEACREKKLRRTTTHPSSFNSSPSVVPSIVHEVLRSPGQPLDAKTRAFMEPRFGYDFSRVRIHTGFQAEESARAVNALAYTVGANVVFASNRYAPNLTPGRQLLAHELTHVVQQSGHEGMPQESLSIGFADDVYERQADRFAKRVAVGKINESVHSPYGLRLQRKCKSPGGCSSGQWKYDYDGCSGPARGLVGVFHFDYDNPAGGKDTHFAKCLPDGKGRACDLHDECYQTCHHGDKSAKERCDQRMYVDMVDTCFNAEGKESKKCFHAAKLYHRILDSGIARNTYQNRQKQVCDCKDSYQMDPNRKIR